MNNKNMLLVVIVALVIGVAAFFGGMKYQETKGFSMNGNRMIQTGGPNGAGQGRMMMRGNNANMVRGEVVAVDETSVTVKLQDGSSKIINISKATTYNKSSSGSATDVKAGETVSVFGTTATDGSVTAQSIAIGNAMMNGMRGGGMPKQ